MLHLKLDYAFLVYTNENVHIISTGTLSSPDPLSIRNYINGKPLTAYTLIISMTATVPQLKPVNMYGVYALK